MLYTVYSPIIAQDTKYSEHQILVDAGKHNKGDLELLILRLTASTLSYSKGYADMFGVVKPQIFLYEEGYLNKLETSKDRNGTFEPQILPKLLIS